MKTFISILLFMQVVQAYADQCSVLPAKQAKKAQEILQKHLSDNSIAVIDKYCEACRDEYIKPIVIDSIEMKDFQVRGYNELYINSKKIDLAYLYLGGVNLAGKIGCKAIGVSKYL